MGHKRNQKGNKKFTGSGEDDSTTFQKLEYTAKLVLRVHSN